MSSDIHEVDVLEKIAGAMTQEISGLQWRPSRWLAKRGAVCGRRYRLGLACRGGFGWLTCHGLAPADPHRLWEITSTLAGPSRLVQSPHAATAHLEATWPWRLLPPDAQTALLVSDLQWLLGRMEHPAASVTDDLGERLRGALATSGDIVELPAAADCWEVRVGRGRGTIQVSFRRPRAQAITASTFVTNWTADGYREEQAAARLAAMMNGRLRWVRLVLRDTAINAEVTLPARALSEQTWAPARDALVQAAKSCRAALRLVQCPAVAAEFLRLYPFGESQG